MWVGTGPKGGGGQEGKGGKTPGTSSQPDRKGLSPFTTLGAQSERTVRKTWTREPEPRTTTLKPGPTV